jgi:hypothetical protein
VIESAFGVTGSKKLKKDFPHLKSINRDMYSDSEDESKVDEKEEKGHRIKMK